MATPSAPSKEEASETLKYQTWVLKVSIHCEGCKKKVRKVLKDIEGVYATSIDSVQNKVTVTGNVDSETLIKKLLKTGKHAELWPEKKDKKPSKSEGKKDKEVKISENGDGEKKSSAAAISKNGEKDKKLAATETTDTKSAAKTDDEGSAVDEESAVTEKTNGSQSKDSKKTEDTPTENLTHSPPQTNTGESSEKAGGGSGGKKKKKKGQNANSNNSSDEHPTAGNGNSGEPTGDAANRAASFTFNPTNQPPYPYPPPFAPQPMYVVSYNTAHPSMSHGVSYYAAPPPYYAHQPDISESYPPAPSGSYDMFSDENPNGCSVM
ncbi:heavy metal-associated isoprenylated plant protein 35-like [Magnolia sinica]|uniref:heavy metal-associated isoprenylated plant protein 35-like n=1 Tax=Magnolia sinica TaxID=86752 RepID=UPI002659EFF8|nr:heavy metal-associated isoprenylated plant protein 35-like [Magnolia sinica]